MYLPRTLTGTETFPTTTESRGLRINHDRARAALLERGALHSRPATGLRARYLRRQGLTEIRVIKNGCTIDRREFSALAVRS